MYNALIFFYGNMPCCAWKNVRSLYMIFTGSSKNPISATSEFAPPRIPENSHSCPFYHEIVHILDSFVV